MRREYGFSLVHLLLVVGVLAVVVAYAYALIPVYNVKGTVQSIFESLAKNHPEYSQAEVKRRLPEIMRVEYIDPENDVPQEFFDNLVVVSENGEMDISTQYHVAAWPLGRPKPYDDPYLAEEDMNLSAFEQLQVKARIQFDFDISAHTP